MTTTARERLADLLGEVSARGSFSTQRMAPVDDLHLEVRGLGPLFFPVPEAQAEQLCRLGRPARYGRGTETLLDRRVRDTWEIPKSRVRIDRRRWNRTLLPMLERLGGDLGLPAGCELSAEWHSMLVYAPGQFFATHQDSEKDDAMVGSLVVTLPSSFTGGALVVDHGSERATYRSSKKSLSFVAFYADCRHQIRPVTSGYRIVLTYNLLLRGDPTAVATIDAPAETIEPLARCLDEHFTTPPPLPRFPGTGRAGPPDRLVYLLDHDYTARSFGWSRLKGDDAQRAAMLRAAAERAGCDVVLALADVHETWSASEPDWAGPWYGRSGSRWDGDGDDDDESEDDRWAPRGARPPVDADDYELDELVDWGITLDAWVTPSGDKAEPIATTVADTEVCATTPSGDLRPYASEYEGYMGNYGNTLDRWYRRAAMVVWPRQRAFTVRAEASPAWALGALSARLRRKDIAEAQAMAAGLTAFWDRVAGGEQRRGFLTKTFRVAGGLQEPDVAAMLLRPFRVEMLTPSHAPALAALAERYGEDWAADLIAVWFAGRRAWAPPGSDRPAWVASLVGLYEALQARGAPGTAVGRLLVDRSWDWLRHELDRRREIPAPSHRDQALAELSRPIVAVLHSTATTDDADLSDQVTGFLCHDHDDLLLGCLLRALRAAGTLSPATRAAAGLDAVAHHCARQLEARLAHPARADDDWSIDLPGECQCPLCQTLEQFLADPDQRTIEWPLAKDGRRHVHTRIDSTELPVLHQTRRTGRPYTLVLTKTEEIFQRNRRARQRDQADLTWLRQSGLIGAPRSRPASPRGSRRAAR